MRLWMQFPAMPVIFQSWIAKKINQAPSVRPIVICRVRSIILCLCGDSFKGVNFALISHEFCTRWLLLVVKVHIYHVGYLFCAVKTDIWGWCSLNLICATSDWEKRGFKICGFDFNSNCKQPFTLDCKEIN